MSTPRIVRIPILPLGMVNAHLIVAERGCILVDAGLPGSETKIARALAREGRTFRDIRLIVVTHAHVDHAGSAAAVRHRSGAPILAHEGDAAHYSGEVPMRLCPTSWSGRMLYRSGLILRPYPGFHPDVLLTGADPFDLAPYGVEGYVRPTPGHTAGSLSVELASRDVLVGDLIASGILIGGIMRTGRAIRPPFEDDPRLVGGALQRLVQAGGERFHLGHGGPLRAGEVARHAGAMLRMPAAG
jgi:hydroxyacylglutathione hydrolase